MYTKPNQNRGLTISLSILAATVLLTLGVSMDSHYRLGNKLEQYEKTVKEKNEVIALQKEEYNQLAFSYASLNQNLEKQQSDFISLKEDLKKTEDEKKKLEKQLQAKKEKETQIAQQAQKKADAPAVVPIKEQGGKEVKVQATAYTAYCNGCSGITRTGVNLRANPQSKVIAVDPTVIPLGSKVYVDGYGYATASDTGGAIKGNRIDIFKPNLVDAKKWGVQQVTVRILK